MDSTLTSTLSPSPAPPNPTRASTTAKITWLGTAAFVVLCIFTILITAWAIRTFIRKSSKKKRARALSRSRCTSDASLSMPTPSSVTRKQPIPRTRANNEVYTAESTPVTPNPTLNYYGQLDALSTPVTPCHSAEHSPNDALERVQSFDLNEIKELEPVVVTKKDSVATTLMKQIQTRDPQTNLFRQAIDYTIDQIDSILERKEDIVCTEKLHDVLVDKRETVTPKMKFTKEVHAFKYWLQRVGVEQHLERFLLNGYESLDYVKDIVDIQDLVEIGITEPSHQRQLLNAVAILNKDNVNECSVEIEGHRFNPSESNISYTNTNTRSTQNEGIPRIADLIDR